MRSSLRFAGATLVVACALSGCSRDGGEEGDGPGETFALTGVVTSVGSGGEGVLRLTVDPSEVSDAVGLDDCEPTAGGYEVDVTSETDLETEETQLELEGRTVDVRGTASGGEGCELTADSVEIEEEG